MLRSLKTRRPGRNRVALEQQGRRMRARIPTDPNKAQWTEGFDAFLAKEGGEVDYKEWRMQDTCIGQQK